MDRSPMELQDKKEQETLILQGCNTVFAEASRAGKETGKRVDTWTVDGKRTLKYSWNGAMLSAQPSE